MNNLNTRNINFKVIVPINKTLQRGQLVIMYIGYPINNLRFYQSIIHQSIEKRRFDLVEPYKLSL